MNKPEITNIDLVTKPVTCVTTISMTPSYKERTNDVFVSTVERSIRQTSNILSLSVNDEYYPELNLDTLISVLKAIQMTGILVWNFQYDCSTNEFSFDTSASISDENRVLLTTVSEIVSKR